MKKYKVLFPNGEHIEIVYAEHMTYDNEIILLRDYNMDIVACLPSTYAVIEDDISKYECIEEFKIDFPDGSNIQVFMGAKFSELIDRILPNTFLEKYFKKIIIK